MAINRFIFAKFHIYLYFIEALLGFTDYSLYFSRPFHCLYFTIARGISVIFYKKYIENASKLHWRSLKLSSRKIIIYKTHPQHQRMP